MGNPRSIRGKIKTGTFSRRDNPEPRRDAIGITCEKDAETAGKILL